MRARAAGLRRRHGSNAARAAATALSTSACRASAAVPMGRAVAESTVSKTPPPVAATPVPCSANSFCRYRVEMGSAAATESGHRSGSDRCVSM
ncbi:hypothetical protein AMETH_2643 [Amycolatopsis methanolica 239]|uniref:Uncharacterized protein n=1 Tax=Amycolatopsis methanolica 239 TaxID=1068978 RepID=A0A076MVH7_AMYME|nr:hypothetical protein AMETH_2643 [Amycolatopsis methanolica 239]